jgi:peptidyl-prolyl cis-trans isomerase SurA
MMRILIAALAVIILLPSGVARGEVVDRIIAIVNDDIITLKEADRYIKIEQQGQIVSVNEYLRSEQLQERIGNLIDDLLIKQQAKKLKLDVSDQEVQQVVDNIKKQNLISDQDLEEQLKKEGISKPDFVDGIRMNMLRSRVLSRVISPDVMVTEAMLKDYFERNRQALSGEEYRLQQIFVANQRPDAQERVASAQRDLKEGKPFEETAKEFSDEPSGAEGGDIGLVKSEELIPVLRDAVRHLSPGQTTGVILTPYGFHILKLNEVVKGDVLPYEAVRDKIRELVVSEESQKRYREYLEKLRQAAYIEVKV